MKVFIHYRRDLYDQKHDEHNVRDRMLQISYDVFSLNRITRDIEKYMEDAELVINVLFEYDLQFFDDNISMELIEAFRKDMKKWKEEDKKHDHRSKTIRNQPF